MSIRHLGKLQGDGMLLSKNDLLGDVSFELDVFETPRSRSGTGVLTGDESLLRRAFGLGSLMLRMADGRAVEIVVGSLNSEGLHFKTSGEVPGF